MSARSCLLLLVAVSAVCFATARKDALGSEEVTGRSLKQWFRPTAQPTYPNYQPVQTTQPAGEGTTTTTPAEGTTATQPAQTTYQTYNPYGYHQPSYGYHQPSYGYPRPGHGYNPYHHATPTYNPYNPYCKKDEVPATDNIYHRKACIPKFYFTGEPAPAAD